MIKILKESSLSFSGDSKEQPEEFLADLCDTVKEGNLDSRQVLRSLRVVFKDKALLWYKSERRNDTIKNWSEFKKSFSMRFIKHYDDEDTLDELKGRSQGRGETMAEYVSCCRFIESHFRNRISEKRLVEILRRNLLPDYQIYLRKEKLRRVSDLLKLGKEFEREQQRIQHYSAPKPKESMNYPQAAYAGATKPAQEKRGSVIASVATAAPNENIKKNKNKKKKAQTNATAAVKQLEAPPAAKPTAESRQPSAPQPRLTGAVLKELPTATQAQPSEFKGSCSICEMVGHRARDCPLRGDRQVCYSCGKPDITSRSCTNEYCVRRRERWGNGLAEGNVNPSPLRQ